MNNEEKILSILTSMQKEQLVTNERLGKLEQRMSTVEDDVTRVRQSVAVIEVEHGNSLGALLDGSKSHQEQLISLTEQVTRLGEVQEIHEIKLTKAK